ncbi:MAG: hypothetical protein D6788_00045, partial [Planctomycetota bacterium]
MTDEELAVDDQQNADSPESTLSEEEEAFAKLKEAITVRKEELGPLRLKLTVTVPEETINERRGEQFQELKREALVPGFRKGH